VNLRRIDWLCGGYVATPTGFAWLDGLRCRGGLRGGYRAVHRCLIAEQRYSAAGWSGFGICWRIRLDRKLATDRARIPAASGSGTSVVTGWWRRRRIGGRTRWEKRERDDPYDKCSSRN
jgi:hypothetical protein